MSYLHGPSLNADLLIGGGVYRVSSQFMPSIEVRKVAEETPKAKQQILADYTGSESNSITNNVVGIPIQLIDNELHLIVVV